MIKYIAILISIVTLSVSAQNSDTLRPSYFIGGSYGMNFHSSNIIPATPCCTPNFNFVSGAGFNLQAGFNYPIKKNDKPSTTSIEFLFGYVNFGGNFSNTEIQPIAFNNTTIDGTIEHRMTLNLKTISFSANYKTSFLFQNLYFGIGPNINFLILNRSQDLIEEIISPSDKGYFKENGKRTRNEINSVKFTGSGIIIGFNVGLSYNSLPLNKQKTLALQPFANYFFPITSISGNQTWLVSQLSFGVNVAYSPFETNKKKIEVNKIDTISKTSDNIENIQFIAGIASKTEKTYDKADTIINEITIIRTDTIITPIPKKIIEKPKKLEDREELITSMKVIGYDGEKETGEVKEIKLQVELSREIYPLLPYIFFDDKKSTLPERYIKTGDLKDFNAADLDPSPTVYHRNMIKILASRMAENSDAKITLTGYTDPTTEPDMCDLAYQRAMEIKNLLVNRYEIAENRISITKDNNCYPKDLTRSATPEAYAENRRVEISTNKPEVLFAVANARYQNPTSIVPSKILAEPFAVINQYKGDDIFILPPSEWQLDVYQNKVNFLSHQSGAEVVNLPIAITRNNAKLLNNVSPLTIEFSAKDNKKIAQKVVQNIRVQKDTSLIEIESLTLTVFQVSQYTLDNRIKKEIRNFVSKLDANSTISIRGYSDNLGVVENNKSLSQVRANEVKDFIRQVSPSAKIIEVVGFGAEKFAPGVSSYSSPEERFISRTVEIEIKKTLVK